MKCTLLLLSIFLFPATVLAQTTDVEYVVWSAKEGFTPPRIVVQYDADAGTGVDWSKAENRPWYDASDEAKIGDAVNFLREGIERTCGRRLDVVNSSELSQGIVFTLLEGASDDIRDDKAVQAALQNNGADAYNDQEAFFIRSEPDRLLVVANTVDGLVVAVPELLESIGYEVLGMGPNWVYTPPGGRDKLAFRITKAGRPGYYLRALTATSGQSYGVGTLVDAKLLTDPADETVHESYKRWLIGRRMKTRSMPGFPGHAMQGYHRAVVEHIRESGDTEGFLGIVKLAPDADRPAAEESNRGWLWINSDQEGDASGKVFHSSGEEWKAGNLAVLPMNLDLSVPAVRAIVFANLQQKSTAFFDKNPDDLFVFGTDPEDGGGYAQLGKWLAHPDWFPEYRRRVGTELGQPYVLHGFKGLDQPKELWDPTAPSDVVYGFNNWLLSEYDRWIDSLPAEQQVTSSGRSRKEAIRCSFYSYNYHDTPPNFNLDPRIRVMIASYPKHRGRGKWKEFVTQTDLAQAFRVMLPREPSGDYWIISLSYYSDYSLDGLRPRGNSSPGFLANRHHEHCAAGFRALNVETDFNFGRMGLTYYLLSQLLWNPQLTAEELDAIRDRWLHRAYGGGSEAMKEYYDFMLSENYPVNSPHAWSRAVRMIEAADQQIDAAKEPDAQRRLNDLKQYWYYYYLLDSDQNKSTSPAMQEFLWKGQMSYMNAMHVVARRTFGVNKVVEIVGDWKEGPAHYTAEETDAWWQKVLEHWPLVPVTRFDEATLADGSAGADVDVNDLVRVAEFGDAPGRQGFLYNAGYMAPPTILCVASKEGDELGFHLYWPADPTGKDRYYIARDVTYGIRRWDAKTKSWTELVDETMTAQPSTEIQLPDAKRRHHLATIRYQAPQAGTYRFEIGRGGNLSYLTDLSWSPLTNKHQGSKSLTFSSNTSGLTQSPTYFYIPKGTKSLDLEVWDAYNRKRVTLYKSLPPTKANQSRQVDISARQTHRIALQPEETGVIAEISGNGFAFPYLYSVPQHWAKSPSQLVVPRAVAAADQLTPK